MARVIVDVMPKPEILDPQGKAVHGALPRLGFDGIIDVRQGKRFELEVDEADEATLAEVREIAETLLSNPVIEDFAVRVERPPNEDRESSPSPAPSTTPTPSAVSAWPVASRWPCGTATTTCSGVDAVILPGGFSYGDYLRCGAIARFAPVMTEVVEAARGGMPVLGICNGFQILCETHLLPGALIRNDHRTFICRDQVLRVENASTAWTSSYREGQEILIPLKNGEGGFVADANHARPAGGGGPRGVPLRRRQPQRVAA